MRIDASITWYPSSAVCRVWTDGDAVRWSGPASGPWDEPEDVVVPDPEAWAAFWAEVDAARAWRWRDHYQDDSVLDGMSWAIELEHDGRSVSSSGSNAQPRGWRRLQRALEALTGHPWR